MQTETAKTEKPSYSSIAAQLGALGGRKTAEQMSPEERVERARKAGLASAAARKARRI